MRPDLVLLRRSGLIYGSEELSEGGEGGGGSRGGGEGELGRLGEDEEVWGLSGDRGSGEGDGEREWGFLEGRGLGGGVGEGVGGLREGVGEGVLGGAGVLRREEIGLGGAGWVKPAGRYPPFGRGGGEVEGGEFRGRGECTGLVWLIWTVRSPRGPWYLTW